MKDDCRETVKQLKGEVNELECQSRRLHLDIHGAPLGENKSLLCEVNTVAKGLDINTLKNSDVGAVHRLTAKSDKTPGIMVQFSHLPSRLLGNEVPTKSPIKMDSINRLYTRKP